MTEPVQPLECEECGEPCHEDASPGVYLHGPPGEPDHDRDADHVARPPLDRASRIRRSERLWTLRILTHFA